MIKGAAYQSIVIRIASIVCAYILLTFSLGVMSHSLSSKIFIISVRKVEYLSQFLSISMGVSTGIANYVLSACYFVVALFFYFISKYFIEVCKEYIDKLVL